MAERAEFSRKVSPLKKNALLYYEEEIEIGEIELFYFRGTRALDNDLDIVDISDSIGQDHYDYAAAVYSEGALDSELVGDRISNDVLELHTISILPEYLGRQYGLRVLTQRSG